jgi:hypothetical protein
MNGMPGLKAGIWELRRIRRGFEGGSCPLCLEHEDTEHVLLKCSEIKKMGEYFECSKWFNVSEDIACAKKLQSVQI